MTRTAHYTPNAFSATSCIALTFHLNSYAMVWLLKVIVPNTFFTTLSFCIATFMKLRIFCPFCSTMIPRANQLLCKSCPGLTCQNVLIHICLNSNFCPTFVVLLQSWIIFFPANFHKLTNHANSTLIQMVNIDDNSEPSLIPVPLVKCVLLTYAPDRTMQFLCPCPTNPNLMFCSN